MSTPAENEIVNALGKVLRRVKRPVLASELLLLRNPRSTAIVLGNLTRPRYYDARPWFSGGVHSDGAMYGPSHGIERHPLVTRVGLRYTLTEAGWFDWFRTNVTGVGHGSIERAQELTREIMVEIDAA